MPSASTPSVKIVRAPAGEAPQWVREAWVGLVLPLKETGLKTMPSIGVLSGPKSALGWLWTSLTGAPITCTGYLTPAARAIEILERMRPEAAAWWREQAPKFLRDEAEFLFEASACERIHLRHAA
jgi:hypothetical protein